MTAENLENRIYDAIIAGGGPSGAVLGFLLQKRGLSCLILEKRTQIDEKICGGFLTNRCRELLLDCGIEMDAFYAHCRRINGTMTIRSGTEKQFHYRKDRFGLGVFRKDLDSFLLEQAQEAGAGIHYGEIVREYKKQGAYFQVNGYTGRNFIWATGVQSVFDLSCISRERARIKMMRQSTGISQLVRLEETDLMPDTVYFWHKGEQPDYFWAIPLPGNTWNIGYWTQSDRTNLRRNFDHGCREYLKAHCKEIYIVRKARAALLGNESLADCLPQDGAFCCGDFSGSNNDLTGEGLMQAVESAGKTADHIL